MSKISSLDEKIAKQLERLKQLKAQKQAVQAREKAKQKALERKNDTRRKILIGAMYLNRMENDEHAKQQILASLDNYLTANRDRELFGLALRPEPEQERENAND